MKEVKYIDLGNISYKKAWDVQETFFEDVIREKTVREQKQEYSGPKHYLLFCEHPHVYTLGKSGKENNLLINPDFLKKIDAEYYKTNRGGDITYHGPGQIVGYPILDLNDLSLGIKGYINRLEDVIIKTTEFYGIKAERLDEATGVWVNKGNNFEKICSIGVRASRYVTMHGFALNVNTDLKYFDYINPCGFTDKKVTSISKELNREIDFEEAKKIARSCFEQVFQIKLLIHSD